jgi:hypothetical protein
MRGRSVARIHHVAEILDEARLENFPVGSLHFNALSDFRKLQLSKQRGLKAASLRHLQAANLLGEP